MSKPLQTFLFLQFFISLYRKQFSLFFHSLFYRTPDLDNQNINNDHITVSNLKMNISKTRTGLHELTKMTTNSEVYQIVNSTALIILTILRENSFKKK